MKKCSRCKKTLNDAEFVDIAGRSLKNCNKCRVYVRLSSSKKHKISHIFEGFDYEKQVLTSNKWLMFRFK